MKNQVKITNKMMMVDFEFPITVGQVKLTAVGQAYVHCDNTGQIAADFEFVDQVSETYMDMPVEGYDAWNKLKQFHTEFGVDLTKLIGNEFDKVVNDNFKKHFLSQFNIEDFKIQ